MHYELENNILRFNFPLRPAGTTEVGIRLSCWINDRPWGPDCATSIDD